MENASPMRQAAISMHEIYTELREAGFSRREGLELISKMPVSAAGAAAAGEFSDDD